MFRRLPYVAVPNYVMIACDTNDPLMIQWALKKRICCDLPKAYQGFYEQFHEYVYNWCFMHLDKARQMSYAEWRATLHFNEKRLAELDQAEADLRGGVPTKRQLRAVKPFGKSEGYLVYKIMRLINPRGDHYKVFAGPMIKAAEQVVYNRPEFVKHLTMEQRIDRVIAMRQNATFVYESDFQCFESHFVPELMMACELTMLAWVLSEWKHVGVLIRTSCGRNILTTRSGVTAAVEGRRMSGSMDTSLSNGFTNMMLAKFAAHRKGKDLDCIVEGDDGLFVTDARLSSADYAEMGFRIDIDPVSDPAKASFCGMVFPESREIIRDPRRFLANFGWTGSFISAGDAIMLQLLRAKALSAVYETPQCPITSVMARYALSKTQGVVPRFIPDGYHLPPDERPLVPFGPSADTRNLFAELYGVDVEMQLSIERAIWRGDMALVAELLPPGADMQHYATRYVEVT
jgi:hypothetical protein